MGGRMPQPAEGYRSVPHTADVRIEAWAVTRERCLALAVDAMVHTFADPGDATGSGQTCFEVSGDRDEDLLVALLDEVIFRMETEGVLPVHTEVRSGPDDAVTVHCQTVDTGRVGLIGAVPKAVALHDLCLTGGQAGWRCEVTLDV